MAVVKPRNRILIFRLTQDEYDHLREACAGQGARSLSEFARQRLLGAIGQVSRVDRTLEELHSSVQRIERLLEKS